MNKLISLSLVVLLCSNFAICDFFYSTESDVQRNWVLRMKFFSFMFGLFAFIKRKENLPFRLFFALICADFFDRVIFNDASFHYSDLLIIFIVLKDDAIKLFNRLNLKTKKQNEQRL